VDPAFRQLLAGRHGGAQLCVEGFDRHPEQALREFAVDGHEFRSQLQSVAGLARFERDCSVVVATPLPRLGVALFLELLREMKSIEFPLQRIGGLLDPRKVRRRHVNLLSAVKAFLKRRIVRARRVFVRRSASAAEASASRRRCSACASSAEAACSKSALGIEMTSLSPSVAT
jgi:hypothetical protein